MNNKIPKAIQLFLTFIKIGAFTFGGGYAMFVSVVFGVHYLQHLEL